MATKEYIDQWKKRILAAQKCKEEWEQECRVGDCYSYWRGKQLAEEFDGRQERRAQVNKLHPAVRTQIPSLYFYRPFARVSAAPEKADTPGSSVEAQAQLLQDTANHFVRDKEVGFRDATFLALKESFWAFGCVEVGYSANFDDTMDGRPPLKETEKTKVEGEKAAPTAPITDEGGLTVGPDSDLASLEAERKRLRASLRSEQFFVKHIPAKQVLISISDKPLLYHNDWVGYWEDQPLEDVKRNPAYKNTKGLKGGSWAPKDKKSDEVKKYDEENGSAQRIRLYKLWDLRAKRRLVLAEGHEDYLLDESYERCALKFYRPDVDPNHFYPRPPLLNGLGPQDEYNDSREYLRLVRKGTRPRFTYDEQALSEIQIRKFEAGDFGTMIPRASGSTRVIEPVEQPSYSENALRTLTISEKEFAESISAGGDARLPSTRTATQAKISSVKEQAEDSFERAGVADWLGEIVEELTLLALDYMNVNRWISVNVAPDSAFAPQETQLVAQTYTQLTGQRLADAAKGLHWEIAVDMESLSPVTDELKRDQWLQGLTILGNPVMARLFSVSPELLRHTLGVLGLKSRKDQDLIAGAMQQVAQMEMQLAQMGQNAAPGVSPPGGGEAPGQPQPPREGGGPQPGGPAGPGASR